MSAPAALSAELLEELDLGSARGAKPGTPVELEIVRSLTSEDLPAILSPPPVGRGQTIKALRHSHHRLAELLVSGKDQTEVSAITGYSPGYISSIKGDPAFVNLMAYYEEQRKTVFVDALERLRVLGIDATERLQEKLHDENVEWSNRELMELVEMAVVGPNQAAKAPQAQGPQVSLEVKFVGARPSSIQGTFTEGPQALLPGKEEA
jgi:hypothetical protein